MFATPKKHVALVLFVVLAALAPAEAARAQPRTGRQRLIALRQQNAVLQQQAAVQTAVQQTTAVLQSAYVQNGPSQQAGTPNPVNLQQQQSAIQLALQQTTDLLQASFRQNSALSQTALRQLNVLQSAQQQTASVQSALRMQNGQLLSYQLGALSQVQGNLMGLLASPPPPQPSGTSRN